MRNDHSCARCGSDQIIPDVHIKDRSQGLLDDESLTAEVYEHPGAMLFKGTQQARRIAEICGRCGYAELYAENPEELWAAYQRSRRDGAT